MHFVTLYTYYLLIFIVLYNNNKERIIYYLSLAKSIFTIGVPNNPSYFCIYLYPAYLTSYTKLYLYCNYAITIVYLFSSALIDAL
jgi:hypothetical protein